MINIYNITAFDIVKWFSVVGLIMYSAFAAVVIRQVMTMNESVKDPLNSIILLVSIAHLILSLLLIVVAIVLL
ncbi:MAG: hypothetical protein UU93_C0005G0061 [Candidatus Amesbacteria bacterium GW2011_GWA2_42_12]|uniref:Uncharacterized protein n=1 Tax=Candidatus Amesbacteria bacterium GW2011_GWA2_42_12 TaxID=1618356 RepID=A0A0G1B5E2_9BACT|nr:MAG: hypothetical protein UU93_C0005G0061 [Candidatus Amesbacteria bacterium GW2011_GWA2_42_12]